MRDRGFVGKKIIKQRLQRLDCGYGGCLHMVKHLQQTPNPQKKERTQQAGDSQCPSAVVCSKMGQSWAGEVGSGRPEFRQDSTLSAVHGAWPALAASTTEGSLLRARSTAQWKSLCGESGAEKTSSAVEKTSSATVPAESAPLWDGSAPPTEEEPCSEAGVAAVGWAFSKLEESAADCGGDEARPICVVWGAGLGTAEADPPLLMDRPCTVNPCECGCVCGEITSQYGKYEVYSVGFILIISWF